MKKRILILNDGGICGGGAEIRMCTGIHHMLKDADFEHVHVVGLSQQGKTTHKKFGKFFYQVFDKRSIVFGVKELIKKYKINIVEIHNLSFFSVMALISIYLCKIPIVFVLHDFWPFCVHRMFMHPWQKNIVAKECKKCCFFCVGFKASLKRIFMRFILNRCTLGIAPGQAVRDYAYSRGFLKNKWKIVTPWIRDITILPKKNDHKEQKKKIYFAGSLLPYKGAWVLAKTIAYLKEENVEFHYIGPNQEKEDPFYQDILKEYESTNFTHVYFHGKIKGYEFFKELANADILVFPSVSVELFGLIWAEAMALKIPVIASDIGGISEYVKDKGTLFNAGDAKDLADKIKQVLHHVDFKKIDQAYQFAKNECLQEKSYEKIRKIYDDLCFTASNK